MISTALTLALIAGGGYAAWFFLGQPTGDELLDMAKGIGEKIKEIDFGDLTGALENFTGFTPDLWNEDPFVGNNVTNLWTYNTKGKGGLTLELWNALDDSWASEYIEAIKDWNTDCSPKVLVLTTKNVDVDNACSQADGVMKVCNGNYGETGWLGINEVLKSVPAGIIQSSVAKMNEHYLLNAGYDERLYTMCHEVGHGFGLPHTDENFNNKDQGNCLDYTNNPSNNLRPGVANCNRLLGMYGSVDGTIIGKGDETVFNKGNETDVDDGEDNGARRQRSLRYRSDAEDSENEIHDDDARYYYEYARSQYPNMTAEYEAAMHELYYDLANGNFIPNQEDDESDSNSDNDKWIDVNAQRGRGKWRSLREHSRGGDFVRRLNDGFELEVHVLYARNDKNN